MLFCREGLAFEVNFVAVNGLALHDGAVYFIALDIGALGDAALDCVACDRSAVQDVSLHAVAGEIAQDAADIALDIVAGDRKGGEQPAVQPFLYGEDAFFPRRAG